MYGLWLFKEIKTEYGNCKVELYRKGYTASAVEIDGFVGNSLNLALENLDTITAPIGKSVCSFAIYDTEQVEYDDLFTPDATAYKVVISTKVDGGEYNTRWSGYVTPDFFAENLSFRTPISISARDNIGYLNDVDFDLDTATITVRELIQAAFNRIAEDYPMSLSFVTQKQTAEGILAIDATISTYLLREMSWYEALEAILHDLGLQMRWVDNNTIAVLDISQLGENFGLQRFNFIERSGYREILPAWRELSQKQDYGLRENFFEGRMKSNQLSFVKSVKMDTPLTALGQDVRYYIPTNWGVARDIYTTDPTFYNSSFGNRLIFSAVSEEYPSTTYLSWKTNILKSNVPLTIRANALNTILVPTGGVTPYPLELKVYDPMKEGGGEVSLQIGLKFNLFLHTRDNKTYLMNKEWVEDNGTGSGNFINIVLDKVSLDDYSYTEGKGFFPIGSSAQEQEITITANTIPYDGELELRIYGYFIQGYKWHTDESYWNPNFGKFFTYIDNLTYTFDGHDISTGQDAKVTVAELHNIKEDRDYSFGQVPLDCGGINAYAGGLFKANGDELVGFKRNVDGSTYPLLELVGREIIHFNKRNYNKLSGTIRNLAKEPLRFDRMFIYKGKNYLPFAYSLDVISNRMNITTMQEVEPYITHSFVEIKSELVTGGGATVSGGNNTALQYSAEVGNAKRISELNNASESEKKESYIVIDNANWNESKKVPLSEMEGLDAEQVEEYLTENKYAKQSWVKGITDDLETDIANRVLIEDFEKLQEAVDLNYTNLNKATTRISTLEGYFSNGVANNAAKLGGQLPSYYATKSALDTTNTNLSNLSTTVGTIAGNLSSLTGRVSTAEDTIKGHTSSINKAVADIAANAKNISTNATNITTVANRVKTLEDLGFILKDGYIYTEKTIVSKGEIISGRRASGTSTDVGGGGISSITAQMIADALGYIPYSSANPAGYINSSALNGYAKLTDIPSLSGYATETWVKQQGYLTQHQDLSAYAKKTDIPSLNGYATEQYVTSRGYITGITSAMVVAALGYTPYNAASFTKSTIKSTLGIADWALAASKPTYTASEVGALPLSGGTIDGTTSSPLNINTSATNEIGIRLNMSGKSVAWVGYTPNIGIHLYSYGTNNATHKLGLSDAGVGFLDSNTLIHTGNYADTTDKRYLQLGGGTITGRTNINLDGYPFIAYYNSSTLYGFIGFSGVGVPSVYNGASWNTLIHSGNIGSQSVNSARKLYYIGAVPSSGFDANTALSGGGRMSNYASGGWWGSTMSAMSYGTIYQLQGDDTNNDLAGQLAWDVNHRGADSTRNLWWRANDDTNFSNAKWHQIAFTDSNVASATKLQTARTIWGQSFDGTGNVSGSISYVSQIDFSNNANTGTGGLLRFFYKGSSSYTSSIYERALGQLNINDALYVNKGGNVLIGTTTDSGYKLQVNGAGSFKPSSDRLILLEPATNSLDGSGIAFWSSGGWTKGTINASTLYLNSSSGGNVLIGTTTDSGDKLQVYGAIKADCIYNNDNATGCFFGLRKTGLGITDGGALVYAYGVNPITFYTNYLERVRIEGNGNVLIGATTDSGEKLQVYGGSIKTDANLVLYTGAITWLNSGANYSIQIKDDGQAYYKAYYGHHFYADGVERLRVGAGGNIIVGKGAYISATDASDTERGILELTTSQNRFIIGYGIANAGYDTSLQGNNIEFTYGTSHSVGMKLTSEGNILMGTIEDSGARLHINASAATSLQAVTTVSGLGIARFLAPNSMTGVTGGMVLDIGVASSTYNSGNIAFRRHSNGNAANFISLGVFGNDNILNVFGSGNVAIGTTDSNSDYKLDVNGNLRSSGNLVVYGSGTIGALVINGTLETTDSATIGGVLVAKGGRLRVNASNTVNSFGFLKATAYTSSLNRAVLDIGSNYGGTSNITSESVDVTALSIYRGVVGVGRAYSYDELYANYNSNTKLYVDGGIANTRTHAASHWDALKIISVGSWSAAPNYVNGIGVTDGSGVVGRFGISFNGTEGGYFSIRDLYTNAGGYASSGEIFKVVGNGNVYVYGNLITSSEVISSRRASSSDRRLKDAIRYLSAEQSLNLVRLLRPAEWDWKDDGKHSMGFIAQDVEQYMPYAVTSIKDDVLGQRLNLQYDQFFSPVVGAIQCLDSEVEQLKRRVKYLENKLQKYGYNRY